MIEHYLRQQSECATAVSCPGSVTDVVRLNALSLAALLPDGALVPFADAIMMRLDDSNEEVRSAAKAQFARLGSELQQA